MLALLLLWIGGITWGRRGGRPGEVASATENASLQDSQSNRAFEGAVPALVCGRCLSCVGDTPVGDATIRAEGQTTTTAPDGRFRLKPGERSVQTLAISASGFESVAFGVPTLPGTVDLGDIYLQPLRQLSGIVVDPAGIGAAGAVVTFLSGDRVLASAESGADGSFGIEYSSELLDSRRGFASTFVVSAHKSGYRPSTAPTLTFEAPVRIVLEKGQFIQGVVLDADTRAPLPNAVIRNRPRALANEFLGYAVATTGPRGEFLASDCAVVPSRWQLVASKDGYAPVEFVVYKPGTTVTILLRPATTIRGWVRAPWVDGGGVARATVFAEVAGDPGLALAADRSHETLSLLYADESAADGAFTLEGVPRGTPLKVTARLGLLSTTLALECASETPITLELRPGADQALIGVHVQDEQGRPIPHAKVNWTQKVRRKATGDDTIVGFTDDNGDVILITYRNRSHHVWIRARAGMLTGREGPLYLPDIMDKTVTLTVGRVCHVRGRVESPTMQGIRVTLWQMLEPDLFVLSGEVRPDADGNFGMNAAAPGSYQLLAYGGGMAPYRQRLKSEPGVVDVGSIRLSPADPLTGCVRRKGVPVGGAYVHCAPLDGWPLYADRVHLWCLTDESGAFKLDGVPSGEVVLIVQAFRQDPMPHRYQCPAEVRHVVIDLP